MALTKAKKVSVTKEITDLLSNVQSAVFVNFHGLSANDTVLFRKSLRSSGIGMKVAKKTLLSRALDTKGIAGDMPVLPGEIAVAYGDDLIAPAREVYTFSQTHKDNVKIVGGVFENRYMSGIEMMSIATIPGMQILRGQFVNLINSPIQGLVLALNAIAEKKA